MNGYDANDVNGDLYWYDTSSCPGGWNITATDMIVGTTDLKPSTTAFTVQFQTGLASIYVPQTSFTALKNLLNTQLNPTKSA